MIKTRSVRFRFGVSALLMLVLVFGLGFGGLRFWVDSYRSEFFAERKAIDAIHAQCPGGCQFITERKASRLLIWLAGSSRAHEFDRVVGIVCAACDIDTAPFRAFRNRPGVINL